MTLYKASEVDIPGLSSHRTWVPERNPQAQADAASPLLTIVYLLRCSHAEFVLGGGAVLALVHSSKPSGLCVGLSVVEGGRARGFIYGEDFFHLSHCRV